PVARVATLDEHRPGLGQEQPVHELEERCFACSTAPDHCDDFAGLYGQAETVEDGQCGRARERHLAKLNRGIGHRACDGTTGTLHNATNSRGPFSPGGDDEYWRQTASYRSACGAAFA